MKKIAKIDISGEHILSAVELNHLHFGSERSERSDAPAAKGADPVTVRPSHPRP